MTTNFKIVGWIGAAFLGGLAATTGCSSTEGQAEGDGGDAGPTVPEGPIECDTGDTTWQGVQKVIFEGYGCSSSACHGRADDPEGGLDLRPEVAYQNLIRVEAKTNLADPKVLVLPGEQKLSFLWDKVSAKTQGTALPDGAGDPMPVDLPALSEDHLEALRLWIRAGAPREGIVEGTSDLLDCGITGAPTPSKIEPPPPPAVGEGLQFMSGPWTVPAGSEDEVCYATYYDLTQTPELVPDWAKEPCPNPDAGAECWTYNRRQLTQDAQSHHSIISVYFGDTLPTDPSWGEWQCLRGDLAGSSCNPMGFGVSAADGGADCGEGGVCGTVAESSFVCSGWGPPDQRSARAGMGGAQSPVSTSEPPDGVYSALPMKGVIIWNSHAFNLTEQDTTVEQYNNFWFARPEDRQYLGRGIFDARNIFVANVPPFEQRTYCSSWTLPQNSRLTALSSHAHKRGWLWQTWLPPNSPDCTPQNDCQPEVDREPEYVSRIYNDPLSILYDDPLPFDDADPASRTIKFCVTYDNGLEDRTLVKRNSTSVGSTCIGDAYCYGGPNEGTWCGSDDSVCGEGGVCDACVVVGGGTTEDEMFILTGGYYVLE